MVPDAQLIADDAVEYRCFTCHSEIRFFQWPECQTVQTVNKRWKASTCGHRDRRIELPYQWGYANAAKALKVTATRIAYPKL